MRNDVCPDAPRAKRQRTSFRAYRITGKFRTLDLRLAAALACEVLRAADRHPQHSVRARDEMVSVVPARRSAAQKAPEVRRQGVVPVAGEVVDRMQPPWIAGLCTPSA